MLNCSCSLLIGLLLIEHFPRLANAAEPALQPVVEEDSSADIAQQREFFEREIRPRLIQHCYACHSAEKSEFKGNLALDSRQEILSGGDSGASIVPGDPDESLLIQAIRYESYEMPPSGKLSEVDIQIFEQWVSTGAYWPEEVRSSEVGQRAVFDLMQRKADHWAWAPIQDPELPTVARKDWSQQQLDLFILQKLEEANLSPAVDVDAAALVRRLSFDLIGLPPSREAVEAFQNDSSPESLERLVDQLLADPAFGERWGRHWLDLVRYAESRGHEFDNDSPNAYQYRDYVIRALNADVPYDQFVREHIAGDLLGSPRLNPETGFNESILGTGFWFLGEWVHSPVDIRADEADRFDNMVDVMSKTFLGMTIACARCHDHKFDAISTADYYALTGFLHSSDFRQVPFEALNQNQAIADELYRSDELFSAQIQSSLSQHGLNPPDVQALGADLAEPVVLHDFTKADHPHLMQDGFLFGHSPVPSGDISPVQTEGNASLQFVERSGARTDDFWKNFHTINAPTTINLDTLIQIPRSGRTLRTPTFELTSGRVFCRIRARGHVVACVDSHRLVFGPLHGETVVRVDQPETGWVELRLDRYVGHRMHLEFTPDQGSALEVSIVLQNPSPDDLSLVEGLEAENLNQVRQLNQTYQQLRELQPALQEEVEQVLTTWQQHRQSLKKNVKTESRLAMAMLDGDGEEASIMIRGNPNLFGKPAPRNLLEALNPVGSLQIESGSGRLQLADAINSPENPLTDRVIVNRIWHHLLGRGIVPTTDDFGVLGQSPTHPELLDHLAIRFREKGRSLKQLIKLVVLSRTYHMSSHVDSLAAEQDPKNLLWHHLPPRRLEGEVIRDTMLKISGRLNPLMFGESVPIHLAEQTEARGKPQNSGPLDGNGRRTIYIAIRRNFLSPFMQTFDTPSPFSTMGRRNSSNVPAQALILMNDPLVVELAGSLAERCLEQAQTSEQRLEFLFWACYSRGPSQQEMNLGNEFLQEQIADQQTGIDDPVIWKDLAHAMLNTKEFIFLK